MLRTAVCVCLCVWALYAQSPSSTPVADSAGAQALLTRYCVGCHNDKLKTGGVSLSGVQTADCAGSAAVLERVLRKVRSGEMPPLGLPAPDPASRAAFTNWLETQLDQVSAAKPHPGAPAIHRMNRAEYSNAIRDLLALDVDQRDSLDRKSVV